MSRIKELFEKKNKRILNVYFTAGFPNLEDTSILMEALQENGVDLIELGMPYSDPLADGPVIQESSLAALQNGMTIKKLFEQLASMRDKIHVPVVLMGYMNTVMQYGFEKFCSDASLVGIDGLILPDLPPFEFEKMYGAIVAKYNLDFVFLVTPETSEERVKKLDNLSSGFLYAVSSSSTTGKDKKFNDITEYLVRLQSYQLKNPILVGFGIRDKATFDSVQAHSNGAIIGSAFIQALSTSKNIKLTTADFIQGVLN